MAQSKFPESSIILREYGEGLLQRLAHSKRVLNGPARPFLLSDASFNKLVAILPKKFPDFDPSIDRTVGYDMFQSRAKQIYEQLEPIYYSFVDCQKFTRSALAILTTGTSFSDYKMDENLNVTTNFLELLSLYSKAIMALSTFEEAKIVSIAFARAHQLQKSLAEPDYQAFAPFLQSLSADPLKMMQEETKGIQQASSKALLNLFKTYAQIRTVSALRDSGAFNFIQKPEDVPKPVIDKVHHQMLYGDKMLGWILFGYLAVPEALGAPGAVELLKTAISEGWVQTIKDNLTVSLQVDFNTTFGSYKSKAAALKDKKKTLKEGIAKQLESPMRHREFRTFIRHELHTLLCLFQDEPGLLAPKFLMVLDALQLAREEILWYFRHAKAALPKNAKKQIFEEEFKDIKIAELIDLMTTFKQLLKEHKSLVQNYYVEYLRGCHSRELAASTDGTFANGIPGGAATIVESIKEEIKNARVDSDFRTTRLNWLRAECAFSANSAPQMLSKISTALSRFTLVMLHTRFIDEFDELVEDATSLHGLYSYRDQIQEYLVRGMQVTPVHTMALIKLIADFPTKVNRYNADEFNDVTTNSTTLVEKSLDEIAARIVALLNDVAKSYVSFDHQLTESNAAYKLLSTAPNYKPAKDFVPPVVPGSESDFKKRTEHNQLRAIEQNAWELCMTLNQYHEIVVYNSAYAPKEYLREKIQESFRKYVRSNAMVEIPGKDEKHIEQVIQRPSILESAINSYISALKLIENYLDLDIDDLLREVLMGESYVTALKKSGTLDWVDVDEGEVKYNGNLIGFYVQWYGDFISKKLTQPNIVFSPNRKCFASKTGMSFHAELYADLNEFKCLANLVGPYGIKLIEREVLKFVLASVNGIKDSISLNRLTLDELSKNYFNEPTCNETLKRLKDADAFLSRSISIGNALCFRELLHEALRWVSQEKIPHIYATVHASFKQYRTNTFMANEFIPLDTLAYDCGVNVGTADQALKKAISRAIGSADAPLLDLLPYMYAASFTSLTWKEADYKAIIEAHTNNIHTLAKAINFLVLAFKSVNTVNANEKEIVDQLKIFTEVSSVILLRMSRNLTVKDKTLPTNLPAVLIFLDLFLEESPLLTRDALESVFPYALLRNEWKALFTTKIAKKKGDY
eukprot:TRINITY_DN15235_c0_g1_i1.p1 TRINITY_DN15235_c0_g1~~TRINITY_DN15235_c0_g1_i1.p1  ORF type:complete len:1144 (-),score=340.06 TRINITY_DN15235_c0_g1_i1:56-3487(-)